MSTEISSLRTSLSTADLVARQGGSTELFDRLDPNLRHGALKSKLTRELGVTLGWDASAYVNYIDRLWYVKGISRDDSLRLYISAIRYFKQGRFILLDGTHAMCGEGFGPERHIQTYINFVSSWPTSTLPGIFHQTEPGSSERKKVVKDTVMHMLGTWTAMLSYFSRQPHLRPIELAFQGQNGTSTVLGTEIETLSFTLEELLVNNNLTLCHSGQNSKSWNPNLEEDLATSPRLNDLESGAISTDSLNAYTLSLLAGIEIVWTMNICRHMILSHRAGHRALEIFALPVVTRSKYPSGPDRGYLDEIAWSYASLFQPYGPNPHENGFHKFLRQTRWCLCRKCFASRVRVKSLSALQRLVRDDAKHPDPENDLFDTSIEILIQKDPKPWNPEVFRCLWPRILLLETTQAGSKPWSFWILLRDRRDSLQYWTFFFGTIVLALTVLSFVFQVVQTVGTFTG